MKEDSVFCKFDVSTPEALNAYNLTKKLPNILQAINEFKDILSKKLPEYENLKESRGADSDVLLDITDNMDKNKEREFLLKELVRVFSEKGITV